MEGPSWGVWKRGSRMPWPGRASSGQEDVLELSLALGDTWTRGGVGRKTPQADQLLKKRQKCKKQPVVTPGDGGMAHLITQVARFPHRPLLPLHSGLRFSADQASSWGRAADEHFRRRGCPGVLWVAAGPGVYTVEGVSSGEGKPGNCVTRPGEEEGPAPRGSRPPAQSSGPGGPAASAPSQVLPAHHGHPEAQRRWRKV